MRLPKCLSSTAIVIFRAFQVKRVAELSELQGRPTAAPDPLSPDCSTPWRICMCYARVSYSLITTTPYRMRTNVNEICPLFLLRGGYFIPPQPPPISSRLIVSVQCRFNWHILILYVIAMHSTNNANAKKKNVVERIPWNPLFQFIIPPLYTYISYVYTLKYSILLFILITSETFKMQFGQLRQRIGGDQSYLKFCFSS